jgi:hypothetical protein
MDNMNPQPQKRIRNQSISSIGQDSDHGSREQRIWRFKERLCSHAIPGNHGADRTPWEPV